MFEILLLSLGADLAKNIAANLIYEPIFKPGIDASQEQRELNSAYDHAFKVMFEEVKPPEAPEGMSPKDKKKFEEEFVKNIDEEWRAFMKKPVVYHLFLDLALEGDEEQTVQELHAEFKTHNFTTSAETMIDTFVVGLAEGLRIQAEQPDSKLFNAVTLGKLMRMVDLAARTGSQIDALKQTIEELKNRLSDIRAGVRLCPPPPSFPAKFGGREKRLRDIMDKIKAGTDTAITAVQGVGGIGKTTLAQALAAQMYTDKIFRAVLWADVTRAPDAVNILSGWVLSYADAAFDVSAFQGNTGQIAQAVKAQLEKVIAEECEECDPPRVLVVLDDVWDNGREAAKLIKRACPDQATILITTRSENVAEDLDATVESLAYLSPDEALEMLRTHLASAPEDGLRRLGKALGGHALALELAARRINKEKRPGETEAGRVERVVAEYEAGVPAGSIFKQVEFSEGEKTEEHLANSLYWTYQNLNPDDQARFRSLGVLAYDTPFDAQLLVALWHMPLEDAYTYANDLRLLSLLDIDGEQYRQHGLLRSYAAGLLNQEKHHAERDEFFNRYADHMIEIAEQFLTLPPEDWGQLAPHLPHIHAVGDGLVNRFDDALGEPEFGRGLARQTQGKARLAPTETDVETDETATALIQRAEQFANNIARYLRLRREVRRREWLEMGLAASRWTGNRRRESLFLNEIALAWSALGEKRKALDFFEQALPLDRQLGDIGAEAVTLNNIGMVWSYLGEKRLALDFYEQALPLRRAVDDRDGEAITLSNIGLAWSALGEKRVALEFYIQALSLFRAVYNQGGEANTLHNIGMAWFALGEKHKALDFFEQALPLRKVVGDRGGEAATLNCIAGVLSGLGEKRKALDFHEQALSLFQAVSDRGAEAMTLVNIAGTCHNLGRIDEAIKYAEAGLAILKNMNLPYDGAGQSQAQYEQFIAGLKRQRDGG